MNAIYALNEEEMLLIATSIKMMIISMEIAKQKDMNLDKETGELYEKAKELLSKIEEDLF